MKSATIEQAVKEFPRVVLKEFLKHRRNSADALAPAWRTVEDDGTRCRILDNCAKAFAQRN